MFGQIKNHVTFRTIRTLTALGLLVALMVVFVANQRDMESLRKRSLIGSNETIWRLNDVIVDTLHFGYSTSVALAHLGDDAVVSEMGLETVLFRFELLWSKVDIALKTDLRFFESFYGPLNDLQAKLVEVDPLLFGDSIVEPKALRKAANDIQTLGLALQKTWQDSYSNQVFSKRELEQLAKSRGAMRERFVLVMIAILVLYLITEARLVSRAQSKQEDLRAEAKAASMASEAKSRFLANVSHEIRTPLNGIIGMSSELLETPLSEDQRTCLNIVSHAGDVLRKTLDDVLDLSKVEAGEFDIENGVFDLFKTLRAAVDLYTAKAREKNISLILQCDDELPKFVTGDKQRVSQVLHNLIGNAIKFTENGSVTLRAKYISNTQYYRFEVQDTGVGIAPHAHSIIFEPFSQVDASDTRSKGGTGLGLAISRSYCVAMGGDIGVSSVVGSGSTFWIELPLIEQHDAPEESVTGLSEALSTSDWSHEMRHKKLLIVDDNATNRFVLRRFLKDTPFQLHDACDGLAAVEAATTTAYDVILMDIQMPVMDGITASNEIRKHEAAQGLPAAHIIAVTANVMSHQVDEYLAEGIDEVLGKPVSKKELLEKLLSEPAHLQAEPRKSA